VGPVAVGSRLKEAGVVGGGELRVGGAEVFGAKLGPLLEEGRDDGLVLPPRDGARRVDHGPAGSERLRAAAGDRRLKAGQALDGLERLSPADIRPGGERAEIGA